MSEALQITDEVTTSDSFDAPSVVLSVSGTARVIEAALFASPSPMTTADLHALCGEGADVGAAMAELRSLYADRGVALREMEGRWAFRTSDLAAPHLYKFRQEEKKLPRAALETLAIIAYHQPITRTEIENIRGVAVAKGTIDLLMEMGWVKPGRRREVVGRPLTWVTTPEFLDHFGLEKLADLPGMEDLKASGLLDTRPAIETIDLFAREDAELARDAGASGPAGDEESAEDLELLPSAETAAAQEDFESAYTAEGEDQIEDEDDFDDDDDEEFDDEEDEDDEEE